jgi:uncharacterized iron-regulated membrane protein
MAGPANGRSFLKTAHNWVGLASAVFLTALLVTGVALNHPDRFIGGASSERLSLAADPWRSGRLYRGTASGLQRTEDGGATWEEVPMLFPAVEVVDVAFHPADRDAVYVLQRWQGVLASRDGGTVWEPFEVPFDPTAAGVELVGLTVTPAGELFLETSAGLLTRAAGAGAWTPRDFDLKRRNWTRIVKSLHNGHFFGTWFVKVYDAAAAALLLLIVTGIVLWRLKAS